MKNITIILSAIILASCSHHEKTTEINCSERVENLHPQYPAKAFALGKEGMVRVGYTVGDNGRARDVRIISATPPNLFERETLAAINRGCFPPSSAVQTKQFEYSIGHAIKVTDLTPKADIMHYAGELRTAIQKKLYAPDQYAGKRCVLQIKMQRDGQINDVNAQGGDPALCQAAIDAVKVAEIPTPPSDEIYNAVKNAKLDFAL